MKSLKKYDKFANPIGFTMSRGKLGSREVSHEYAYTSKFGFVCSVFVMAISLSYLGWMVVRMYNMADERYSSEEVTNLEDTPQTKEVMLRDHQYYIATRIYGDIDWTGLGLWDESQGRVKMDELRRYFVPQFIYTASVNGTDTYTRVIPAVHCPDQYNETFNGKIPESYFKYSLCPDKTIWDKEVKLEGFVGKQNVNQSKVSLNIVRCNEADPKARCHNKN
jgi:hypothetical protein